MTRKVLPVRASSINVDDRPIGDYLIDISVNVFNAGATDMVRMPFTIKLDDAMSMRTHLDNAIDSLMERIAVDALCGDCKLCDNTRMVHSVRHGHDWTDHCPECHPKIEAFNQKIKNPGQAPKAQKGSKKP